MKNRNLSHSDHWTTPPYFYNELNEEFDFDFDPCPLEPTFNGLLIEWGDRNFVNPPYSLAMKEAFVNKALEESKKGKLCVVLLPVSTSTKLFHEVIAPNNTKIKFIKGRIPFIGTTQDKEGNIVYVNWHLSTQPKPEGKHVKNSGQHDSMVVIFDGRAKKDEQCNIFEKLRRLCLHLPSLWR